MTGGSTIICHGEHAGRGPLEDARFLNLGLYQLHASKADEASFSCASSWFTVGSANRLNGKTAHRHTSSETPMVFPIRSTMLIPALALGLAGSARNLGLVIQKRCLGI
jgi:hypothetical protein